MKSLVSILFVFCLLVTSNGGLAGELEGVKMPEKLNVGGTDLVLNGMTLRKASNFGIQVKVYVGGLYLTAKEKVGSKIVESESLKRVVMHFIFFRAPKGKIKKGWKESYNEFCADKCAANKKHLKTFLKQIKTMTKHDVMTLDFYKDKLSVQVKKKKKITNIDIPSGDFAKIILKAFVKAKNKEFLKGLLGT